MSKEQYFKALDDIKELAAEAKASEQESSLSYAYLLEIQKKLNTAIVAKDNIINSSK